jgi:hypothetical protein
LGAFITIGAGGIEGRGCWGLPPPPFISAIISDIISLSPPEPESRSDKRVPDELIFL